MTRRTALAAAIAVAAALGADDARAAMDDAAYASLARGQVVSEKIDVDVDGADYLGGVAYVAIHAPADDVMIALLAPENYRNILPLTLEANVVDRRGGLVYVRLRQGGRSVNAVYTIVVKRESRHLVRFWLDPGRPHDIADCWGFFGVEPSDDRAWSLVRYGALVHLDFGFTKLMFSEKIRDYALTTPSLLRRFVERRRETAEKSW